MTQRAKSPTKAAPAAMAIIFSVSKIGLGGRCSFRWTHYRGRLLREFCANVTTVLPIDVVVGNLRRLCSILRGGHAQPPVLALAAALALVSARPELEAELALAVGQVTLIQTPTGV